MVWLLCLFIFWAAYAYWLEPNLVRSVHYTINLPELPPLLNGLVLVHLSDLHGKQFRAGCLEGKVAAAEPDILLLTGDMFEAEDDVEPVLRLLGRLPARAGKYFVSGNNEHGKKLVHPGTVRLRQLLAAAGVQVLDNRNSLLSFNGAAVCLAGVDDYGTGLANLPVALRGVPANCLLILLSHTPDVVRQAQRHGVHLVVAGHTHGGQVCLPFWGPLVTRSRLGRRFAAGGVHRFNGCWLAVTRGLGTSGIPVRFCCPPEVAVYTLRRIR